jgi:dTDP-4-dehydrorhamnose reductase
VVMQLRCLVIGGDGTIGRALRQSLLRAGHSVMSTTRRQECASTGNLYLDLEAPHCNFTDLDVAIFCAGISGFVESRISPALTDQVNVKAPAQIAATLTERGTRVIRLSSSAVFSCVSPRMHSVDEPVAPRSTYGKVQASGEQTVLGLGPLGCVVRLTKVVSPQFPLINAWMEALGDGNMIEAFMDHGVSAVSLDAAVASIQAVAEHRGSGIFQVSGRNDISYLDLAYWLVGKLGLPGERVVPVLATSRGMLPEEITPYTAMDTARITELTGFVPEDPLAVFETVLGSEIVSFRRQLDQRGEAGRMAGVSSINFK